MKISTKWLRRYLDTEVSEEELWEVFTSIGLEVEGVEHIGVARQNTLVVGKIQEIRQHPNADKLSVCTVCVGQGDVRQIVCGAKNFKLNDHVPVALPGTVLPGDFTINKSTLRGVESDGMMCSGKELGLGEDHSGLLILGENTTVGACLHDAIEINCDAVFDISLTANRGDCLSHIGVARDLAAKLNIGLKLPQPHGLEISETEKPQGHFLEKISIETDNCECYSAICIKNIKIGDSPDWMKQDLTAIGARPINNAVDIGNWVMMETGQPVHIFDAKKIRGNQLTIRQAKDGETIISLDGKKRTLTADMVVICDVERPLVVAGITGTVDAEVDDTTTDVLIESAYFNPDNIRKSAKTLNISTESAYRFSKDIDTANVANYGQRVANLVTEICGGEIVAACWKVGDPKRKPVAIDFQPSSIEKLCGFAIPLEIAENILTKLGFSIEKLNVGSWKITIPAHRPDITNTPDIVSECLRIYGTDKIPTTPARYTGIQHESDRSAVFCQNVSNYLSGQGFFECYNFALRNCGEIENLFGENSALSMRNPFNVDQNCYRSSLIPGLLDATKFNIQNGNLDVKFFETGHVVLKIDEKFNECLAIGCVMPTKPLERSWQTAEMADFYDIKSLILPILKNFSQRLAQFNLVEDSSIWQPGHAAHCGFLNREKFQATCGFLNVKLAKDFDIKQHILAAEIVIHPAIFTRKPEKASHKPFSQFPRISKDLSLIVKLDEVAANVENNVMKAAQKNISKDVFIESIKVFDVYLGKEIPTGTKNIGLTINYRSNDRTLTDSEIQTAFNATQLEIEKLYEIRKQA
ncbi:MAG: phenylalanine--tRNA ligase subunit beta [Puniceicoccales bacterium]|jgi:phenylalanyl-tRNA synthetase beta chain|nr:phenylalanine--tRNA ligase subunit beta [Puniceicoccales bacterium]